MINFELVQAILQFSPGTEANWNNFQIAIPKDVIVVTTDTQIFKRGDGTKRFSELPMLASIEGIAENSGTGMNQLVALTEADENCIIIINDQIYDVSIITLQEILDLLTSVTNKDILQDNDLDIIDSRAGMIGSVGGLDSGKLAIVEDYKLAPGKLPEDLVGVAAGNPIYIRSIGLFNTQSGYDVPTWLFPNQTYYIRTDYGHDSADTDDLLVEMTCNLNGVTITDLGRGTFKIELGQFILSELVIFTVTASYGTDSVGHSTSAAIIGSSSGGASINLLASVYGGTAIDKFYGVAVDGSGFIIAAGETNSEGFGNNSALVVKFDSDLNMLARKIYGGTGGDYFRGVAVDSANNIICAGVINATRALVVKFDPNLNILAQTLYNAGTTYYYFRGVAVDSSNNVICAGHTNNSYSGNPNAIVVKLDSNLNTLVSKYYGIAMIDTIEGIAVDSLDNIICVGSRAHSGLGAYNNGTVVKLDPNLNLLGSVNYSDSGSRVYNYAVAVDSSDNIYCVGAVQYSPAYSALIVKFDSNLDFLSHKTYAGTAIEYFYGITVDSLDNIICVGRTTSEGSGGDDALVVKFDSALNMLAGKVYGGTGTDRFLDVAVDSLDNIICVGYTDSEGAGGDDALVLKLPATSPIGINLGVILPQLTLNDSNLNVGTTNYLTNYINPYDITLNDLSLPLYDLTPTLANSNLPFYEIDDFDVVIEGGSGGGSGGGSINLLASVYGGTGNDTFYGVTVDSLDDIICVGRTLSEGSGGADTLVVKFDSALNMLARKIYGGTGTDLFNAVAVDSANNIICAGYTNSEGAGSYDALVVKFDDNLDILARKIYGGTGTDIFYGVAVDSLDNISCVGTTNSEGAGGDEALIVKFDSNLDILARKIYGGAGADRFSVVTTDSLDNIICIGNTNSEGAGYADALVVKFDSNLNILARKIYGGTGMDYFRGVVVDSADNVICVGETASEGAGNYDALVVKFDSNLAILARKVYGGTGADYFWAVVVDSADNIICVGYTSSEGAGGADTLVVKFDSNLDILARKIYGGTGADGFFGVTVDSLNNIICVGYTFSEGAGGSDALVLKVPSDVPVGTYPGVVLPGLTLQDSNLTLANSNLTLAESTLTLANSTLTLANSALTLADSNLPFHEIDDFGIEASIAGDILIGVYGDYGTPGSGTEHFYGVVVDSANNIICVGLTNSEGAGNTDALVVKFDSNLNILARKIYGGTGTDYFQGVTVDSLDNIICVGTTNYEGTGSIEALVVKFDSNLNILASKIYGKNGNDYFYGVAVDSADNIICVGLTSPLLSSALVVKFDSNLNILASKIYGSSRSDYFRRVTVDSLDNIICVGYTTADPPSFAYDSSNRSFIVKFDSALNFVALSNSAENNPYGHTAIWGVTTDSADNIICAGYTATGYSSGGRSNYYTLVVKFDSNLNLLASKAYGGTGSNYLYDAHFYGVAVDSADNIICAGSTNLEGAGSIDALVVKFDSNLNILASKVYGGAGADDFYGVAVDSADNIICVGYTNSDGAGGDEALILKLSSNIPGGTLTGTIIQLILDDTQELSSVAPSTWSDFLLGALSLTESNLILADSNLSLANSNRILITDTIQP